MYVFIVGNLGSGKGTLIKELARMLKNCVVVEERFEQNPFLELYSNEGQKWAFPLQLNFLLDYLNSYRETIKLNNKPLVLIDSGVWTNWFVYMEILKDEQLISMEEYSLYTRFAKNLVELTHYPEPNIILYVTTPPEICLSRILERGWSFQKNIKLTYLKDLHKYFLKMINKYKSEGTTVIEIDNENSGIGDTQRIKEVANKIKSIFKD